jgi:hypothetical protein
MQRVTEAANNRTSGSGWPQLTAVEVTLTGNTHCDYTTWESQADMNAAKQTIREVKNYTGFSQLSATDQQQRLDDLEDQVTNYLGEAAYQGGVIVDWKGPVPANVQAVGTTSTSTTTARIVDGRGSTSAMAAGSPSSTRPRTPPG